MPPEVGCNWVKAAPQVGRERRRGKLVLLKEVARNDIHLVRIFFRKGS